MSCFDLTTCPSNQIFNRINCNFTNGYVRYICNPSKTCPRTDGLYDCCASNIADCIIEYSTLFPTTSPTILPNIVSECENTCNLAPSTNTCYWYENQNLENSCIDKNDNYCCSHSRSDCCHVSLDYIMILLGSLFFLLIICIFYHVLVLKYTRVVPETNTSSAQNNDNIL